MAGSGRAPREAAPRPFPTVCGLWAGAGASDDGTPAGAALPAVPPRRDAAAADGARRSRTERADAEERRRSDSAAGERALGRCPVPAFVHVAAARPAGRPRRIRDGLRAFRTPTVLMGTYIGGGDRDGESGHVGRRRSAEGTERANDKVGEAVSPLRQAPCAVLPVHAQAAGQPETAPRSLPAVPACGAGFDAESRAVAVPGC